MQTTQEMQIKIKYGLDGSGGHRIFKRRNNMTTNNIIMTMFCPLEIQASDGNVVWKEDCPNAPHSQRVLSLHRVATFPLNPLRPLENP